MPYKAQAKIANKQESVQSKPDNTIPQFVDKRNSTTAQLQLQDVMRNGPLANARYAAQSVITSSAINQQKTISSADKCDSLCRAPASGSLPVLQAVWHYVEETGRERNYNLKDNKDGTFTHSKSGVTYQDTGKQAKNGQPLLTAVNSIAPTLSGNLPTGSATQHDPKNVLFAIRENGKIEYLPNTAPNRVQHAGKFLEMDPANFAIFKNGGKRSESAKVVDPVTLTKYHYDGKHFHEWDKSLLSGKGKLLSNKPTFGQIKSEQDLLAEKLKNGELVDRRRDDRTSENLSPFDVGPYKTNVTMERESDSTLSRTFPKLSGIDAWTSDSMETNRDHVPSGESLNQRGGTGAYDRGFTIAIPNYLMHQPFSPTFGSDNSVTKGMDDELPDGSKQKRVLFDSENPSAAFHKDTSYMLDKTSEQDYSANHAHLDLTKPRNRARQVGAYRHLYRRNVRLNQIRGGKFGVNHKAAGMDFVVKPRVIKKKTKKMTKREGAFAYSHVKGKTQGELIANMLAEKLRRKKLAQDI